MPGNSNRRKSLTSFAKAIERRVFKQLNAVTVGNVVSFNPGSATERPTCSVRIAIDELDFDPNGELVIRGERMTAIEHPPIEGIPVVYPQGGGRGFVYPLSEGDPVLLVSTKRGIGQWKKTYGRSLPDLRFYAKEDMIAIPGFGIGGGDTPLRAVPSDRMEVRGQLRACNEPRTLQTFDLNVIDGRATNPAYQAGVNTMRGAGNSWFMPTGYTIPACGAGFFYIGKGAMFFIGMLDFQRVRNAPVSEAGGRARRSGFAQVVPVANWAFSNPNVIQTEQRFNLNVYLGRTTDYELLIALKEMQYLGTDTTSGTLPGNRLGTIQIGISEFLT